MTSAATLAPRPTELKAFFRIKHGDPRTTGWSPALRHNFGYFTPDDVYEATIAGLVTPGCRWIDVGGGRDVFPSNPKLAQQLADRCGHLLGLDPSDTIHENPFAHRRVQSMLEDFTSYELFDLATMRMVAEHIANPTSAVAALARLVRPGGKVVVLTVNQWSPVTVASWLVPFGLHHPVKSLLWQTEEKDTYPVVYRMNTRSQLGRLFTAHGFRESHFAYLDDCRTFHRFRWLHRAELMLWKGLRTVGLRYPETCLLGVYERA